MVGVGAMGHTARVDSRLLIVLGVGLATVVIAMTVTAFLARALNRVAVVDITWPLGFVAIAWVSAILSLAADDGDGVRRWVLLALVAIWGGRLAWHIRARAVGHGEDPRYEKLLGGTLDQVGSGPGDQHVFVVQGVAMWFISSRRWWARSRGGPLVAARRGRRGGLAARLPLRVVGDAQLASYKALPEGPASHVMETGAVALHPPPQLLRRRLRLWGLWLAGGLRPDGLPAGSLCSPRWR